MEEKRILGLDMGKRRVGVAISDPQGIIARPLETIIVNGFKDGLEKVRQLIPAHNAVAVVIGLPLNMSGQDSEISQQIRKFADQLRTLITVPVYMEDERLSSKQAEAVLHSHGKKIMGNKDKIDRISAAIILQSFLDRGGEIGSQ